MDVPARVAVHAPGVDLLDIGARPEGLPPLDRAVHASLAAADAAALLTTLRVLGQACALGDESLLLQAASHACGIEAGQPKGIIGFWQTKSKLRPMRMRRELVTRLQGSLLMRVALVTALTTCCQAHLKVPSSPGFRQCSPEHCICFCVDIFQSRVLRSSTMQYFWSLSYGLQSRSSACIQPACGLNCSCCCASGAKRIY